MPRVCCYAAYVYLMVLTSCCMWCIIYLTLLLQPVLFEKLLRISKFILSSIYFFFFCCICKSDLFYVNISYLSVKCCLPCNKFLNLISCLGYFWLFRKIWNQKLLQWFLPCKMISKVLLLFVNVIFYLKKISNWDNMIPSEHDTIKRVFYMAYNAF